MMMMMIIYDNNNNAIVIPYDCVKDWWKYYDPKIKKIYNVIILSETERGQRSNDYWFLYKRMER